MYNMFEAAMLGLDAVYSGMVRMLLGKVIDVEKQLKCHLKTSSVGVPATIRARPPIQICLHAPPLTESVYLHTQHAVLH